MGLHTHLPIDPGRDEIGHHLLTIAISIFEDVCPCDDDPTAD